MKHEEDADTDAVKFPLINSCDTELLSYQVAGHKNDIVGGILKHKEQDGYVLKPVQKGPLGLGEVEFYRKLQAQKPDNEVMNLLKIITPDFRGLCCVSSTGPNKEVVKTEYLVLEDIAQGFERPCLVDIKVGKQTWDPTASDVKIKSEMSKYFNTRSVLGISIPGIQYYDVSSNGLEPIRGSKEFGKELNAKTLFEAFQNFLNKNANVEKLIARSILQKLEKINKFFEVQRKYAFYASSLLIAYDAKFVETNFRKSGGIRDSKLENSDWLRVYMIDFTHVFPANGQPDMNYIFALKNIIRIFSAIAEGKDKCD